MNKIYQVTHLDVTQSEICFELEGQLIHVPLSQTSSDILPNTSPEYLRVFELDEDGIGIHWPVIDEDLSIEGLLRSAGRPDLVVKEIPSVYLDEESERHIHHTTTKDIVHA